MKVLGSHGLQFSWAVWLLASGSASLNIYSHTWWGVKQAWYLLGQKSCLQYSVHTMKYGFLMSYRVSKTVHFGDIRKIHLAPGTTILHKHVWPVQSVVLCLSHYSPEFRHMKWCTISSLKSPKRSIYFIIYLHLPLNYLSFQSKSIMHWVSGTIDLSLFIKPPNPGSTNQYLDLALVPSVETSFRTNPPFSSAFFWLQNPPFRDHTSPVTEAFANWVRKCIKGFWNSSNFPMPLYHHVRVVKNGY